MKVFVKIDNASRRALEPKARAGVYVGYHDISDSHRVLVKNQTRFDIVNSIHVQVHERELGMPAVLAGERARLSHVAARVARPAPAPVPAAPAPAPAPAAPAAPSAAMAPALQLAAALERDPLLDDFGDEDATVLAAMFGDSAAPLSYRAAMQSTDSDLWSAAVRAEIDSLVGNGTFQAVSEQSIPVGKKILTTRWVFTRKSEADGSTRHKARLVARGDHQRASGHSEESRRARHLAVQPEQALGACVA